MLPVTRELTGNYLVNHIYAIRNQTHVTPGKQLHPSLRVLSLREEGILQPTISYAGGEGLGVSSKGKYNSL